jgi:translation initiation factor 1
MKSPGNRHRLRDLSELHQLLPDSEQPSISPKGGPGHDGKGKSVRVYLDTQGRKGKTVTIVEGLQHNPQTMEEVARTLKQYCGAGGTVKEGRIEIQGDQRFKVSEKLKSMNYTVASR